jgi:hypothetical protein
MAPLFHLMMVASYDDKATDVLDCLKLRYNSNFKRWKDMRFYPWKVLPGRRWVGGQLPSTRAEARPWQWPRREAHLWVLIHTIHVTISKLTIVNKNSSSVVRV